MKILELFHSLIGDIRSVQDRLDATGKYLEITFFSHDAARKALCMSGYTISGAPLIVRPVTPPLSSEKGSDDRRNLYVLGIPFALTKSEFTNVFSRYGVVTHSVILATVDNSSRRRGFVVMSSHEEAGNAMAALNRTQIRGHTLDISWAVVQRSQGFLDGGDRNVLDARAPQDTLSPPPAHDEADYASANSSDTSVGNIERDLSSLTPSLIPTTTLLVMNLPAVLFSQVQDLRPLFFPFGRILKLEVVQRSAQGLLTVLVQYDSTSAAQDAKQNVQGQCYGELQIEACYIRSSSASLDLEHVSKSLFSSNNKQDIFFGNDRLVAGLFGAPHEDRPHWTALHANDNPTHRRRVDQTATSRPSSANSQWNGSSRYRPAYPRSTANA
ncbi:RNA-binding domain-containing protein [Pluteus cervinus]|uniref:RNA-binding domain-containing protein n=1 Tax=Pluteus cervinus TaxID=181527 RepID=A0ACD3B360_9AGAR|nr:RNA-binding domain-containing protein [Pluteus cervinus]